MLDKVRETSVDEDILDFLKYVYFGDFSNPIEAASGRAYLDMNRTLRLKTDLLKVLKTEKSLPVSARICPELAEIICK